jgi:hypothetical protein
MDTRCSPHPTASAVALASAASAPRSRRGSSYRRSQPADTTKIPTPNRYLPPPVLLAPQSRVWTLTWTSPLRDGLRLEPQASRQDGMNVVKNRPSNLTLEINVGSREAVVVVDDDLNNR